MQAQRRDRLLPTGETLAMNAAAAILASPRKLAAAQRLAALGARLVTCLGFGIDAYHGVNP